MKYVSSCKCESFTIYIQWASTGFRMKLGLFMLYCRSRGGVWESEGPEEEGSDLWKPGIYESIIWKCGEHTWHGRWICHCDRGHRSLTSIWHWCTLWFSARQTAAILYLTISSSWSVPVAALLLHLRCTQYNSSPVPCYQAQSTCEAFYISNHRNKLNGYIVLFGLYWLFFLFCFT